MSIFAKHNKNYADKKNINFIKVRYVLKVQKMDLKYIIDRGSHCGTS